MLGNSMRKYVMSENKNGYSKAVQSVYNSRIKTYAKQALQDLALLAEKLPEDQQAEIFNEQKHLATIKSHLKTDLRRNDPTKPRQRTSEKEKRTPSTPLLQSNRTAK